MFNYIIIDKETGQQKAFGLCQDTGHMLSTFREFCFNKASQNDHGEYPYDNTFNDTVEQGFSEDGTCWTAENGITYQIMEYKPLNATERLIKDIKDFVGEGGYVPVTEHGNKPTMNMQAADTNGIVLRWPIGRERRRRIEYSEMDTDMLKNVILELFRYQNYCQLYA